MNAIDLSISAAVAGCGVVHLFEDWLRPALDSGALEPVLEPWWQSFSGPCLYYHGRDHVPAPLKAFIGYVEKTDGKGLINQIRLSTNVGRKADLSPRSLRRGRH